MEKVFVLLIVFSAIAALGQESPRKFVVWSGDKTCGIVSPSLANENQPECISLVTPRGPVSIIRHNSINLSVAFLEVEGYIIVAAQIDNASENPIEIDTDLWGAAHFSSMEDFTTGAKPLVAETSVPSREIVRGIKSGVGIDNSSDTFMASITKGTEIRETRRSDGTRVRQAVIVEDADAKRVAISRNDSRVQHADAEQTRIRQNAITQKWIGAVDKIKGLVYFRRVKKSRFVVFSFGILDTSYIFRLPRNKS